MLSKHSILVPGFSSSLTIKNKLFYHLQTNARNMLLSLTENILTCSLALHILQKGQKRGNHGSFGLISGYLRNKHFYEI